MNRTNKVSDMQAQATVTRTFTPDDLHCVEAVLWELRQQCARLRAEYPAPLSTAATVAASADLSQTSRQFLILERHTWQPMASFSLWESWRSDTVSSDVETEFDLCGMTEPGGYLELDGIGLLPQLKMATVLAMALSRIRKLYESAGLAGIVSRFSLPLWGGDKYLQALMHNLRNTHHGTRQVAARVALRQAESTPAEDMMLPPGLHAWLQQGACIGNEVYWDAERGHARLLIWLPAEHLWRLSKTAQWSCRWPAGDSRAGAVHQSDF